MKPLVANVAGTSQKKILVVDDSSTVLLMATIILRDGAYAINTATNGREAIEKVQRQRPDLILMDVTMPEMTGFEACRALKSREETRDIPIILVTTHSEANNVQEAYEAGCTDYISKPIAKAELLAKVKRCLGE